MALTSANLFSNNRHVISMVYILYSKKNLKADFYVVSHIWNVQYGCMADAQVYHHASGPLKCSKSYTTADLALCTEHSSLSLSHALNGGRQQHWRTMYLKWEKIQRWSKPRRRTSHMSSLSHLSAPIYHPFTESHDMWNSKSLRPKINHSTKYMYTLWNFRLSQWCS